MARGRSNPSGRAAEFLGLAAFALAVLVTLSLLSFDPLDPSFFVQPSSLRGGLTRNLAGAVGANLAHALLIGLGLLAYAAPVVLVAFGVRKLRPAPSRLGVARGIGMGLLWLSLAALLAVTLEHVRYHGSDGRVLRTVPVPAGGIVGQAVAHGLGGLLGSAGTLVVLLTALASALLLATPISFARAFEGSLDHGQSAWQGLITTISRALDRRRKEKDRARAQATQKAAKEREDRLKREGKERQDKEKREAKERDERVRREAKEREEKARREAREQEDKAKREARERDERAERERKEFEEKTRRETEAARERELAEAARAAAQVRRDQVQPSAKGSPARREAGPVAAVAAGAASPAPTAAAAPAAKSKPEPAAPSRPAAVSEAARVLARDQAARAAAATLKLDQQDAAPAPDRTRAPGAAQPPAAAAPTDDRRMRSGSIPTPQEVAALAAAASGAMRKAREERMEIDIRKKPPARPQRVEDFALPPLSLLETVTNDAVVTERELVENAKVLVSKLKEFSVDGTVQAIHPGPVVTTYEYRPEAGVKYSKIVGLADDLCLAMKAEGVRIDRISGKSAVGIEVPNSARETIGLRDMLESDLFQRSPSRLSLCLGKGISGEPYMTDLRKMPHLLIAGATGSGKSVAVNCMIVSVLYKATPEEVKFIMVDPKRIELGVYDGIPHLLVPVVTDCRLASNALRWAVVEMENRYKRLASHGVRSLEQFNSLVRGPEAKKLAETRPPEELQPLPYIVILIDELADLMMVAANDVEDSISRLAAMARAVGIHLVLATQRPSVDVITGVIKANFPSRISFRVSSKVDSRTILDSNGAEMLLGKGDMLFMPPGSARLLRVHGAFISDGEVQRLVNYLKNQREPQYNEEVLKTATEAQDEFEGEMDEMYDEAVRVVLETGQASVSHLQRRLRLGYSRAARLVDMMELNGIVGPSQGAKGRDILVDRAKYLEQLGATS